MKKLLQTLKSTKAIGEKYEQLASRFLHQQGITIITKNYHAKGGEIDIIASHDRILVFCEVRARSNIKHGKPEETVTYKKQLRIRRTAQRFLQTNPQYQNTLCRFDVISIIFSEGKHTLNWIKNAF